MRGAHDGAGDRGDRARRARGGKASRSGKIGVIGTEATIASGAYTRTIQRSESARGNLHARLSAAGTAGRRGLDRQRNRRAHRSYYLESLKASGIDTLLLGCTHYPLLRGMFERVLGARVKMVDSAIATAAAVREQLDALRPGAARGGAGAQSFFVTETPDASCGGRRLFGPRGRIGGANQNAEMRTACGRAPKRVDSRPDSSAAYAFADSWIIDYKMASLLSYVARKIFGRKTIAN